MQNTNKSYGLHCIEDLRGSKLIIYQRFFKYIYHNLKYINDFFRYINDSTKNIDLPTNSDMYCYL
ncbi:hypothetical protein COK59_10810 [Bacillus thuringiensis]|nr:hypothetical protein CON29_21300 [Bacillus thuringiensis]PEV31520.1 hypothetical protein CN420_04170 [Bacillus thuringiensis]PFT08902.1 hypothetical protein COK59_10810 [Bacillus thuringiensis]PFU58783.1 hypothetical protein COK85_16835 [Bacillus thuringiensis]